MIDQAQVSYKASKHHEIEFRRASCIETSMIASILILLSLAPGGFAQTAASPYQVGTWQGFRSAAVSYTFDDNLPNQLAIAIPMFDQFGFKVTLFTVTGPSSVWPWPANWSGLQKAAAEGHEIASHTITHPNFSSLADSLQQQELELSQDTINAHIPGHQCITIAYPYCVSGNEAIDANYYIAGRGCSGQIVSTTPSDFMNISSFVLGDQGTNTVAGIESIANSAASQNGWCVYLIHGINGTEPGAYSPISQDTVLATVGYLYANPTRFWVAPFGTVARYIKERNSASVSQLLDYGDSVTVQLTDNLDSAYYNVPLAIRRPLPTGWDSASVCQNGDTVNSEIVRVDTVKYIMFDAVPNAGNITLVNESGTVVGVRDGFSSPATFELLQNYPNPFNPTTKIEYFVAKYGYVSLKVDNVLGEEVATLFSGIRQAGNYIATFDGNALASGVYFYRLSAGGGYITRKLLLMK
jgi:hypothetical protein